MTILESKIELKLVHLFFKERHLMQLHDTTIAQIVKLIQMALLTGTDIIDHFRMMQLKVEDDKVILDEDYLKVFNESIEKMMSNIPQQETVIDE